MSKQCEHCGGSFGEWVTVVTSDYGHECCSDYCATMAEVNHLKKHNAELEQRLAAAESKIAETEDLPDWAKVGDGTLHSAIDYWYERATVAEYRLAAAESRNADLSMLVARLIRKNPESGLSIKSVEYLKRNNLIGSQLKAEAPGGGSVQGDICKSLTGM